MSTVPTVGIAPAPELRRARDLRIAAGGLVGAAAIWPLLPVHPPFACPLRAITGIPCPFCGMTRACVAAMQGHFGASLSFNPGGVLIVALALVALVRPRFLVRMHPPTWSFGIALGVLWVWNIGFNPTFHQLLLR